MIFASAQLARRAPQEWAEFLSAFAEFASNKDDECISSSTPTLPVAQGRAQACRELRKLFAECKEQASKIETKESHAPRKP